jgi:hypothetical protein
MLRVKYTAEIKFSWVDPKRNQNAVQDLNVLNKYCILKNMTPMKSSRWQKVERRPLNRNHLNRLLRLVNKCCLLGGDTASDLEVQSVVQEWANHLGGMSS